MQRYQQTLIVVYSTLAAKWRGANDVKVASFARRLKIRHFSEKRTCVAGLCQTFCGLDRAVYGVAATNQLLRAGQRWRKELSTDRLLELEGKCTCCPTMLWTYRGGGGTGEREPQSLVSTMVSSLRGSVKFKHTDTLLAQHKSTQIPQSNKQSKQS